MEMEKQRSGVERPFANFDRVSVGIFDEKCEIFKSLDFFFLPVDNNPENPKTTKNKNRQEFLLSIIVGQTFYTINTEYSEGQSHDSCIEIEGNGRGVFARRRNATLLRRTANWRVACLRENIWTGSQGRSRVWKVRMTRQVLPLAFWFMTEKYTASMV